MSANKKKHENKLHTIPTQSTKNSRNSFRVPPNSLITSDGSPKPLHQSDMYLYKTL